MLKEKYLLTNLHFEAEIITKMQVCVLALTAS